MSYRFLYLRSYATASRDPIGCLMVSVNREAKEIRYAFSVCAPSDKFNRSLAQDLALGRLHREPIIISGEVPTTSHQITRLVMEDIAKKQANQSSTTSRSMMAEQSAINWLNNANKKKSSTETIL